MKKISKYPEKQSCPNWDLGMAICVNDVLKREHKLDIKLPNDIVNRVAVAYLGHDLCTYNNQVITRDTIREITKHLLPIAKKLDAEKPPTTHYWSRNDPNYIKRRI